MATEQRGTKRVSAPEPPERSIAVIREIDDPWTVLGSESLRSYRIVTLGVLDDWKRLTPEEAARLDKTIPLLSRLVSNASDARVQAIMSPAPNALPACIAIDMVAAVVSYHLTPESAKSLYADKLLSALRHRQQIWTGVLNALRTPGDPTQNEITSQMLSNRYADVERVLGGYSPRISVPTTPSSFMFIDPTPLPSTAAAAAAATTQIPVQPTAAATVTTPQSSLQSGSSMPATYASSLATTVLLPQEQTPIRPASVVVRPTHQLEQTPIGQPKASGRQRRRILTHNKKN